MVSYGEKLRSVIIFTGTIFTFLLVAGCSSNSSLELEEGKGCELVRDAWNLGWSTSSGRDLYLQASKIFYELESTNRIYSAFATGLLRASRGEPSLELYDVATFCGIKIK